MEKLHYFEQTSADSTDILLQLAKKQGYVPINCLLNGKIVMSEINKGNDPCTGCHGPRTICHGRYL